MDLDEWEYIPDEGFLEINDDGGQKIFSRKKYWKIDSNIMFKDYFKKPQFVDSTHQNSNFSNQFLPIPIPIQFHPTNLIEIPSPISTEPIKIGSPIPGPEPVKTEPLEADSVSQVFFKKTKESHEFVDSTDEKSNFKNQIVPIPIQFNHTNHQIPEPVHVKIELLEPDPVSQVFFKKAKETHEFVEMKMDSPKSGNRVIVSESMEVMKKDLDGDEEVEIWRESDEGMNIWKWGLSGIGAICSFGVVAATVCIIILGTGSKQSHHHKISFHVYQDDNKSISQVVNTSKYNEAISAAKGVPLTRARVTFGGYFDAL